MSNAPITGATKAAATAAPDYSKLDGEGLIEALGGDPSSWATAALQHASIIAGGHLTHGFLRDWFARALGVADRIVGPEDQAGFVRAVAEVKQERDRLLDFEKALLGKERNLVAFQAELDQRAGALHEAEQAKSIPGVGTVAVAGEIKADGGQPAAVRTDPVATLANPDHPPGDPEE